MNNDTRAKVLAALREVYDGHWDREVGTEGGRHPRMDGPHRRHRRGHHRLGHPPRRHRHDGRPVHPASASTPTKAQDGVRTSGHRATPATRSQMRQELSDAVAGVLAGMNTEPITAHRRRRPRSLLAAADLVTLARTGVEYDYRGDVIDAHAPEMPTRFAKQLAQIVRGGVAIGMDRADALRLAIRCARDSMPPLRLAIIDDRREVPRHSTPTEVRRRLDKPRDHRRPPTAGAAHPRSASPSVRMRTTAKVAGAVALLTRRRHRPDALVSPNALPEKSPHTRSPSERGGKRGRGEGWRGGVTGRY